ncbi:unnamed protein product [Prunus armeniaca]|uniref:Uncharacterized protein n=1 Tax=Prunus armeniaca TaxID=36596 RepID=A0A6J5WUX7_PRUAR|nr:unnamed protein product [Prunus armeniaca]
MNSWTQQKGYPVISVKVKDQNLEFDQAQFYSSGSQGDGQWIVPITLCCGSYDISYKLAKIAGDAVPEQLNFGEVDFM